MPKEQENDLAPGHKNKGNDNPNSSNNSNQQNDSQNNLQQDSNYNLINEESSNSQESANDIQESIDAMGNLPINLSSSAKTDFKKSECFSTHLDKKEDNNTKKKRFRF